MGQKTSRQAAKESFSSTLNLPLHDSSCKNDSKKCHTFLSVSSAEWLHKIYKENKSIHCSGMSKLLESRDSIENIFQYGHKFPKESKLIKVNVTVLKKKISFCIKNESTPSDVASKPSIYDVFILQQAHAQQELYNHMSQFTSIIENEEEDGYKQVLWNDVKQFLLSTFKLLIIDLSKDERLADKEEAINIPFSSNMFLSPILAIIENDDSVFIFEKFSPYTLQDALNYSPAVLLKSHTNLNFLLYQILSVLVNLMKHNIHINKYLVPEHFKLYHGTLWTGLSLFDAVNAIEASDIENVEHCQPAIEIYSGISTKLNNENIILDHKLSFYTKEWVNCRLSNFDYLIILNKLSGKKFGQPLNHPVFPWVTDFTAPYGGYRDLKKTKFRLNKGDGQLDATFSTGVFNSAYGFGMMQNPIQHHVSDVLSDITYFMYHARQTSKEILCQHVRSRWVPDEYPANVQRMYEWTPDECIPEFYYDPKIFKSTHDDLTDLGIPEWVGSPEEFVKYHYAMLESSKVSSALHHWIDLVFGYKLEGKAARHAKNVHLGLVDDHKDLKNYGIVQLFNKHHPKRRILTNTNDSKGTIDVTGELLEARPNREFSMSWEYVDYSSRDQNSSLNQDIVDGSVSSNDGSRKQTKSMIELPPVLSSILDEESFNVGKIHLVKNKESLVFSDIMDQTEKMLKYELLSNPPSSEGVGVYKFGTFTGTKLNQDTEGSQFKHLSDTMKMYLCLVIEIVCFKSFRTRTFVPELDSRLKENLRILEVNDQAPSWIKETVKFAIQSSFFGEDDPNEPVKYSLQTIINTANTCFNFNPNFERIEKVLSSIYNAVDATRTNKCHTQSIKIMPTDADTCNQVNVDLGKCSKQLKVLLEDLENEEIHLLLMMLEPLFEDASYQLPMYIHIFPPLSIALGPEMSRTVFLKGLQRLLDSMSISPEICSLVQQSFLSNILQAFGQDYFLEYIMGLLLDILSSSYQGQFLVHKGSFTKVSTSTAPPSTIDASLPSESFMSFEVSPYVAEKDSISISSFNLDVMFSDDMSISSNQRFLTDSHESGESTSLNSEIDMEGTPKLVRASASITSRVPQTKTHTVLCSQEILSNSGLEEMIEVSATSQPLPSFSYEQDRNLKPFIEADPNIPKRAESAPFTILLPSNSMEENNTNIKDPILEDVPADTRAGGASNRSETLLSEDLNQILDLHCTVIDSLKWFIPWLGPNLSTEHIARPLLRNMGKMVLELSPSLDGECTADVVDQFLFKVSPHIECLLEAVSVYGDSIVTNLYVPRATKLIENATNAPSVSISLGSNLVSHVQLLLESFMMLQIEAIATHMEEFSVDFFQPLIRLLSTVKPFSTGVITKRYLAHKVVDILGLFCQKLRREYAQEVMAPLLQQFFSCFDGIYALRIDDHGASFIARKYSLLAKSLDKKESETVPVRKQRSADENTTKPPPIGRISKTLTIDEVLECNDDADSEKKFADVYDTFSPSLAYHAYVLFCRVLGTHYVENTLYNSDLVWQLCTNHDDGLTDGKKPDDVPDFQSRSFRKRNIGKWMDPLKASFVEENQMNQRVSWQHLEGNWLKNWQTTFDGPSRTFNFLNLKLQTYAGHSSAIRDVYVADNEHYFLSASRDKSVKLWLLKNHGNGTAHLGCSGTYEEHERAVFAVQGLEAKRVVASCDGEIHIWDPVTNEVLRQFSASRGHSVTCIRTLPAPSVCVAAATSEGCLRIYDIRQKNHALDWKVSPNTTTGVIRSMCVDGSGTWIAAGFSSGIFSAIDIRAGILRGQARIHDGEILQMEALSGNSFASSAVDSIIRIWNDDKGTSIAYKSSSEPFNTLLYTKQQLVWASNNKLTIHNPHKMTQYQTHKLNTDTLKGALTKMAVLPMNHLYLFGVDNDDKI